MTRPDGDTSATATTFAAPTLDAIFRTNVRRTPEALALADPPDRSAFTAGPGRCLSYAELDRAVDRLAARLCALGLLPGTVVATQLPNIVEGIVAILALWRADLIAAPLPLLWRHAEAAEALHRADARALIVAGTVAGIDHAEIARETAAAAFNLRYVCGFGTDVADGMVALGDIFSDSDGPEAAVGSYTRPASPAAARPRVITFETQADGPAPTLRADAQLLAGGLAVVLAGEIPPAARMLGTMLPSSFAVLAATVVPWLLTGGSLRLHHPFAPAALAAQLAEPHHVAILPGALLPSLIECDVFAPMAERRIIGIWRAPEQHAASPRWTGPDVLTDILAFGELGIVPLRRGEDGAPGSLRSGTVRVPADSRDATTIMTLSRSARGTLALSGPMLPLGGEPVHDSDYACRVDPHSQEIVIGTPPSGVAQVGGYQFAMAALQDILGRADVDGVLAALPDLLAGQKLAGAAPDPARIRQTLAALGLSPLVSGAFHAPADRKEGAA